MDDWFADNPAYTGPTTDEMDHTTPEDRHALVGYCESDQQWYKFIDGEGKRVCPDCGGKFSNRVGFQITSQRTFNPAAKKMTKAQLKKMAGGAA